MHVAAPPETCRQWNAARDPAKEEDRYPDEVLDNLIFRYEEPNGMARWDSPLFTVPYVDAAGDMDGIWNAMVSPTGVVVKANQATVLVCSLPFPSFGSAADGRRTETGSAGRLSARAGQSHTGDSGAGDGAQQRRGGGDGIHARV